MRPINKRVILKVPERESKSISIAGKEFIVDTRFRKYWHAVQVAEVVGSDNPDLNVGDTVYTHHFIMDERHHLPVAGDENMYSWLESSQIYCRVRNGEIKMLNNYLLVEPVKYSDERTMKEYNGIILSKKSDSEYVDRIGVVRHLSDSCRNAGLSEGDRVLFGKNCEYDLRVEGDLYYRMELMDILTILDDTKLNSIK